MLVIYPRLKRRESRGARGVCGCLTAASLFAVSLHVGAQPASPPAPGSPPVAPSAPAAQPSGEDAAEAASPDAPKSAGVLTTGAIFASLEERVKRLQPSGAEPCEVRASLEQGERLYVACGPAGVWIIEVSPTSGDRLLGMQALEGSVVGVFVRGERVWVELSVSSARPLSLTSGGQLPGVGVGPTRDAPEPAAPVTSEARTRVAPAPSSPGVMDMVVTGRVLSSHGGRVVVDLGSEHDVNVGSHVEFVVTALDDSPLGKFQRRQVVAVGRASSVTETQSLVELGVAEEVPLGAQASVSSRPLTRNRSAPPRAAGLWTVSGIIRPFFVLEELGIGALNELSVGYQSHGPLRYQLQLSPIAFASAGPGATIAALAIGLVSYDTRLFEIGLGFGFQTVNDGDYDPGTGLTVAQSLRFGALDGLNLSLRNDISLFHSEFEYSAFSGEAQVPVSDRGWMVLEGGGGTVGYAFVEVGGKVLLAGNGTRGSLFLRGTIGYAALYENRPVVVTANGFAADDELFYGGPLIGLGVEWRN